MFRRLATVAGCVAVAVPLLSGTASASCTDDLFATNFTEGYYQNQPSNHYYGLHYVHTSGTATVLIEGDALLGDVGVFTGNWTRYADVFSGNAVDATTEWVDCVAG